MERVDVIVVHVARLCVGIWIFAAQGDVNGANLRLANLDEQNGRRIHHALEHGNTHDDEEDCENANFEGSGLLH